MAENKKSFVLYTDYIEVFEQLTDVEAGELIKHLFRYVNDKNPNTENRLLKILFEPIKQQLKRDLKKWEGKREKLSEAGKISAEKRKLNQQMLTNVGQPQPTPTVNVNVNDTVTVIDNVIPNTENNFKSGLVIEMAKIFKIYNPLIDIVPELHYPPCLQIAYRIAKMKGWQQKDVLNGKMSETLKSWDKIVEFTKTEDYLASRSLIDLNNQKEWDRLVNKMQLAKNPIKKVEIEVRSPIKKESEVDFKKYQKRN